MDLKEINKQLVECEAFLDEMDGELTEGMISSLKDKWKMYKLKKGRIVAYLEALSDRLSGYLASNRVPVLMQQTAFIPYNPADGEQAFHVQKILLHALHNELPSQEKKTLWKAITRVFKRKPKDKGLTKITPVMEKLLVNYANKIRQHKEFRASNHVAVAVAILTFVQRIYHQVPLQMNL